MAFKLKVKTGSGTPGSGVLDTGEFGYDTENERLFIGNGSNDFATSIGGELMTERIYNGTGSQLNKLAAVYVNGAQGQRLTVALAKADAEATSSKTLGLVAANIINGAEGEIAVSGLLRGVNASGSNFGETWNQGDAIYLSPSTTGALTKVKPYGPNHMVLIGFVVNNSSTSGSIFVKVQNGFELEEIHNVAITSTPSNGQALIYDATNSVWIAGTPTSEHADTSSQASVDNSGVDYVQDIALDTYGHVTSITSTTIRDASASQSGLVNTGSQTFAGNKTFNGTTNFGVVGTDYTGNNGSNHNIYLNGSTYSSIGFHDSGNTIGHIRFSSIAGFEIGRADGTYGPHNTILHGKLGIGTTTPNEKLEITNAGNTKTAIKFLQTGVNSTEMGSKANDQNFYITNTTAGTTILGDASTSITLKSDGKTGIGTTTPRQTLDVNGNIQVGNGLTLRGNAIEQHITNGLGSVAVNYYGYNGGNTQYRDFDIYNGREGFIATFDGTTSRLGIGTETPTDKLTISHNSYNALKVINTTTGLWTGLQVLGGSTSADSTIFGQYDGGKGFIYNAHDSDIGIFTNATERFIVKRTSGNVGIGELSPSAQLQVKSGATTRVPLIIDTVASHTARLAEFKLDNVVKSFLANDGRFQGVGISNITYNNAFIETANTGLTVGRNIADTNPALIVNLANASATGDVVKFQKEGTELTTIDNLGRLRTNLGLANLSAAVNGVVYTLTTGVKVERNVADSNTTLLVNQANASSTGNLLDLQAAGTNIISFKKDGTLLAPATFTIDPSAHGDATGKVIILGDLQVDGTTTTINSTTLEVDDKNIELSKGAANKAASDGAGISIDLGTDGAATLTYGSTADEFSFNKGVTATGTSKFGNIDVGAGVYKNRINANGDSSLVINSNGGVLSLNADNSNNVYLAAGGGRVGIGTTNPQNKLSVITSSNTDGLQIRRSSNTANDYARLGFRIDASEGDNYAEIRSIRTNRVNGGDTELGFFTSAAFGGVTEKLRITETGYVGIGTTSPSTPLHIANDTVDILTVGNKTTPAKQIIFGFNAASNFASIQALEQSVAYRPLALNAAGGNVGIGTTNPISKLEVSSQMSSAGTIDYPFTLSVRDDANSINQIGGEGVGIKFRLAGNDSTTPGNSFVGASIAAIRESSGDTESNTSLGFFVSNNDETLDESMRITSTGNVGIGTTTPSDKLDVNGTIASRGNEVIASDGSANYMFVRTGLYYQTSDGGSNLGIMTADGKVGIGTTTPSEKLHVVGDVQIDGDGGTIGGSTLANGWLKIGSTLAMDSNEIYFGATGYIGTIGNFDLVTNINGSEIMRITGAGNVGIGTNSPGKKLHVSASSSTSENNAPVFIQHDFSGTHGYGLVISRDASSTIAALSLGADSSNNALVIANSSDLIFGKSTSSTLTEHMRILNSNGNVGIGTTTPTAKLDVNGNIVGSGDINITGTLYATAKSFLIDHPTKPGMKLKYGSLEGPENAVYVRGKLKGDNVIELPEYWTKLIDEETITVSLTPIGRNQRLFVKEIKDNKIYIQASRLKIENIECYYLVHAERKDISKLEVEM